MFRHASLLGLIAIAVPTGIALAAGPEIDPKADEILKQMSACIADAKTFSLNVNASVEQFTDNGMRVEVARNQKLLIRRPDRASATVVGDLHDFDFFYDGAHVTLFNPDTSAYATIDAPHTLDQMLDFLADKYGLSLPLADLAFSSPYKALTEDLQAAQYMGLGYVFDVQCHHIACSQDAVDWQIWIDTGQKPLPRKLTITYKLLPGQPHYTAYLSKWDLSPNAPDAAFAFSAPASAKQVPWVKPTTQPVSDRAEGSR